MEQLRRMVLMAAPLIFLLAPLEGYSQGAGVAVKVAELPVKDRATLIQGMDFSPDGSRLAVPAAAQKINIWDWRKGGIEKSIEKPEGASGVSTTNPLNYSPDGKLFALCDLGAGKVVIRMWRTSDWSIARDITESKGGACNGMAFTPDGQSVIYAIDRVIGSNDLVVVSTVNWTESWRLPLESRPHAVGVTRDGKLAAVAGEHVSAAPTAQQPRGIRTDETIDFVDLQQHKVVRDIRGDLFARAMGPIMFSADGRRLAIAGNLHLNIFDVQSGQAVVEENLPAFGHMNVRFSADGRYFVESDMNGRGTGNGVRIWDSQRGKLLQEIPGNISAIAVSRDSKYLALADTSGLTTIWKLK